MSLSEIQIEYERHLDKEKAKIENRKNKILLENPDIKEIQDKINDLDFKRVQYILSNEEENNDKVLKINKEISKLIEIKKNKIDNLKLPKDFLEIKYKCDVCKDKGYIKKDGKTVRCNCITQRLLNERYNNSNLNRSENETFENFRLDFYRNDIVDEKGNTPRDNAKEILEFSKEFVRTFKTKDAKIKNIFFTGKTGLGKTFLSNAIAKEILKKGYTIFYQTAPTMLDELMIKKYQDSDMYYDMLTNINNADLLIIDDFGAENLSESKMKEIFSIINYRLIKNKSTLISSNLKLEDLPEGYDDRIVSRIFGNYTAKRFIGDDIRILKKKKMRYE